MPSAAGDAEVLIVLFRFLGALGLTDLIATLNCIPAGRRARPSPRRSRSTCGPHAGRLGPEDRKRLAENPLRLFDSKDPEAHALLRGAPATLDFLDEASRAHHEELKRLLSAAAFASSRAPRSCAVSTTTR